jgi:hypothetical protein
MHGAEDGDDITNPELHNSRSESEEQPCRDENDLE